jgi:hypothetical protein
MYHPFFTASVRSDQTPENKNNWLAKIFRLRCSDGNLKSVRPVSQSMIGATKAYAFVFLMFGYAA